MNSAYMDDICDSVDAVKEAKQLIEDVDNVLKEGGFKLKGVISNKPLRSQGQNEKDENDDNVPSSS